MSALVFSNIPADHLRAEEQQGVVWQTLDPSRFPLPSQSILRIHNWPMLCAEIVDEGEAITVIIASPHWDEGGNPVACVFGWTYLEMAREVPLGMISSATIPGQVMMAWFSLDAIAVATIGPAPDERGQSSTTLCLTAKKTSKGILVADLRRGSWDHPPKEALRVRAFLEAEWPSRGSPRAHLHPGEFPSQDAGTVVLALIQERKRHLVLCYAGDAAWLERLIDRCELGLDGRGAHPEW